MRQMPVRNQKAEFKQVLPQRLRYVYRPCVTNRVSRAYIIYQFQANAVQNNIDVERSIIVGHKRTPRILFTRCSFVRVQISVPYVLRTNVYASILRDFQTIYSDRTFSKHSYFLYICIYVKSVKHFTLINHTSHFSKNDKY